MVPKSGMPQGAESRLPWFLGWPGCFCRARVEAKLGGIQSWVSCIFKPAFDGATASHSLSCQGNCPPVRMGEVGNAEPEGAALGLCFRRLHKAAVFSFENPWPGAHVPVFCTPAVSHFTNLKDGGPDPVL